MTPTAPEKRKHLTILDVPPQIIARWKRQEQANRKRAREKGADTLPVDFVKIVIAYDAKCCICFEAIDIHLPGTDGMGLTLEHIIALGQGGHHVAPNIGPAHRKCNEAKNNQEDTPKAAKVTRVRNAFEDFYARMNGEEPPQRKKRRKIPSRKMESKKMGKWPKSNRKIPSRKFGGRINSREAQEK